MDTGEWIALAGVGVTFGLGVWSHLSSKSALKTTKEEAKAAKRIAEEANAISKASLAREYKLTVKSVIQVRPRQHKEPVATTRIQATIENRGMLPLAIQSIRVFLGESADSYPKAKGKKVSPPLEHGDSYSTSFKCELDDLEELKRAGFLTIHVRFSHRDLLEVTVPDPASILRARTTFEEVYKDLPDDLSP